jgi:NAD(P)-dependent dehydrogenase (short-subunit alcohol dehydrogenase family)
MGCSQPSIWEVEQVSRELAGRRALVTGSAGGIGGAIAAELLTQGADVLGLDVHEGGPAPILVADLSDGESTERVVAEARSRLGEIDILVNCAGMSEPEAATQITSASYHRTLQVNLHAPVMLMSRLGESMVQAGYGRIVNITSIHGKLSEPLSLAYDTSKAGLEAATRTFALELAPHGVLVNAVAPGFVKTQMSIVEGENELESEWFQSIYVQHARLPLRRAAQPEEIAALVAWLVSERNSYLTGQTVTVDGGLSVRF